MEDQELMISELAQRAGISVRTIRYYVDEGLLPPPIVRGKYGYFSEKYLLRLELIRRMKEAFFPLREIRLRLNSMSDREVEAFLQLGESQGRSLGKSTPRGPSSAADYIQNVLENSPEQPRGKRSVRSSPISDPSQTFTIFEPKPVTPASKPPMKDPEEWLRIEIAPGIELHIRQPVDRKRYRECKEIARKISEQLR